MTISEPVDMSNVQNLTLCLFFFCTETFSCQKCFFDRKPTQKPNFKNYFSVARTTYLHIYGVYSPPPPKIKKNKRRGALINTRNRNTNNKQKKNETHLRAIERNADDDKANRENCVSFLHCVHLHTHYFEYTMHMKEYRAD